MKHLARTRRFAIATSFAIGIVTFATAFGTQVNGATASPGDPGTPGTATPTPPPTPSPSTQATAGSQNAAVNTGLLVAASLQGALSSKATKYNYNYDLTYNGQSLLKHGTTLPAFYYPGAVATPSPAPSTPSGDTNAFSVNVKPDALTPSGTLANLLGVKPLTPNGFFSTLRGAAWLTANVDNTTGKVATSEAIGLETAPLTIPLLSAELKHLHVTNWVVVGLQGQHQAADTTSDSSSTTPSTSSNDVLAGEYRSFFAFPIGPLVKSQAEKTADKIISGDFAPKSYASLRTGLLTPNGDVATELNTISAAPATKDAGAAITKLFHDQLKTIPAVNLTKFKSPNAYDLDGKAFLDLLVSAKAIDFSGTMPVVVTEDSNYKADFIYLYIARHLLNTTNAMGKATWPNSISLQRLQFAANFAKSLEYIKQATIMATPAFDAGTDDSVKYFVNALIEDALFSEADSFAKDGLSSGAFEKGSSGPVKTTFDTLSAIATGKDIASVTPTSEDLLVDTIYANRLVLQSLPIPSTSADPNAAAVLFTGVHSIDDAALWQLRYDAWNKSYFSVATHPKLTAWLSDSGWDIAAGEPAKVRCNNLFNASLRYYFTPQIEKGEWFALGYENGREQAAPTQYQNYFTVSLGLKF